MIKYIRGTGIARRNLADFYRSIPQATTMLAQRRLRLVGHTLRSKETHPLKLTLGWTPKWCKRKVVGPKTTLNDTILKDAGYDRSTGWSQLKEDAKNREVWGRVILRATRLQQSQRGISPPAKRIIAITTKTFSTVQG